MYVCVCVCVIISLCSGLFLCTLMPHIGFMGVLFFMLIVSAGLFGNLLFLSVLYACVFYFCICTCSAQLSMFHMEKRSRNMLIIIIIIITILSLI